MSNAVEFENVLQYQRERGVSWEQACTALGVKEEELELLYRVREYMSDGLTRKEAERFVELHTPAGR